MCYYVKDDYEQCGMDEGPYCRHHDDTIQAELYERTVEKFGDGLEPNVMGMFWRGVEDAIEEKFESGEIEEALSEATGGSQSDASGIVMDETCDDCEAPLRRTERLSQHPNQPRRLVFEAVVECDCDEHVLGATSERIHSLPEGWT